MADPVTASLLGVICWQGLDVAWEFIKGAGGNMVYDQAKQAVGLKDKWRNHHVPDAFARAWRQAVKATRDEYVKEFSHHLGGSMEEAIREATDALSKPDFLDGWLKKTAAAGGFDLAGNLAASWDDQISERAKTLTNAFRQHMPALSVTLRNVPESFYQFWEGAFLHKLMYFFVEAAVKDDPKAWAQIQFNIFRSQCEMLAGIREDTAATRAMVGALARLLAAHAEVVVTLTRQVSALFVSEHGARGPQNVLDEAEHLGPRVAVLIQEADDHREQGDLKAARSYLDKARRLAKRDGGMLAMVGRGYVDYLDDYKVAEKCFRQALRLSPEDEAVLDEYMYFHFVAVDSHEFYLRLQEDWPVHNKAMLAKAALRNHARIYVGGVPSVRHDSLVKIKDWIVNHRLIAEFPDYDSLIDRVADPSHPGKDWIVKLQDVIEGKLPPSDLDSWEDWVSAEAI